MPERCLRGFCHASRRHRKVACVASRRHRSARIRNPVFQKNRVRGLREYLELRFFRNGRSNSEGRIQHEPDPKKLRKVSLANQCRINARQSGESNSCGRHVNSRRTTARDNGDFAETQANSAVIRSCSIQLHA